MKNSTPKDLSPAALGWFKRLQADHEITDHAGLMILESAMRQFDRAEAARREIDLHGVLIVDRWEQRKPNPACAIERDARAGMLAALRALNLDLEPLNDRPGRPGGS